MNVPGGVCDMSIKVTMISPIEWLANLADKKVLEASDILGIIDPDDDKMFEYEHEALMHPIVLECVKNQWLRMHFVAVRQPSVYWKITEAGKDALYAYAYNKT